MSLRRSIVRAGRSEPRYTMKNPCKVHYAALRERADANRHAPGDGAPETGKA